MRWHSGEGYWSAQGSREGFRITRGSGELRYTLTWVVPDEDRYIGQFDYLRDAKYLAVQLNRTALP